MGDNALHSKNNRDEENHLVTDNSEGILGENNNHNNNNKNRPYFTFKILAVVTMVDDLSTITIQTPYITTISHTSIHPFLLSNTTINDIDIGSDNLVLFLECSFCVWDVRVDSFIHHGVSVKFADTSLSFSSNNSTNEYSYYDNKDRNYNLNSNSNSNHGNNQYNRSSIYLSGNLLNLQQTIPLLKYTSQTSLSKQDQITVQFLDRKNMSNIMAKEIIIIDIIGKTASPFFSPYFTDNSVVYTNENAEYSLSNLIADLKKNNDKIRDENTIGNNSGNKNRNSSDDGNLFFYDYIVINNICRFNISWENTYIESINTNDKSNNKNKNNNDMIIVTENNSKKMSITQPCYTIQDYFNSLIIQPKKDVFCCAERAYSACTHIDFSIEVPSSVAGRGVDVVLSSVEVMMVPVEGRQVLEGETDVQVGNKQERGYLRMCVYV